MPHHWQVPNWKATLWYLPNCPTDVFLTHYWPAPKPNLMNLLQNVLVSMRLHKWAERWIKEQTRHWEPYLHNPLSPSFSNHCYGDILFFGIFLSNHSLFSSSLLNLQNTSFYMNIQWHIHYINVTSYNRWNMKNINHKDSFFLSRKAPTFASGNSNPRIRGMRFLQRKEAKQLVNIN